MPRLLLTWSDRVALKGQRKPVRRARSVAKSPVLQFVEQASSPYDDVWVLSDCNDLASAEVLCDDLSDSGIDSEIIPIRGAQLNRYDALLKALIPLQTRVQRERLRRGWHVDVLLSSGTAQAQTLWVVLVLSGLLPARMVQLVASAGSTNAGDRAAFRELEVKLAVGEFPAMLALESQVARLRGELRGQQCSGKSQCWEQILNRCGRVAASDIPVLISGECGSGKRWLAQHIHRNSSRSAGPYIAENCGAFDSDTLAGQLFGYDGRGLATGEKRRAGLLEQAHGGTLFLAEVEQLSARVQANLVRALQEGRMRSIGGTSERQFDVRVLVGSHQDLALLVERGEFREDLYFLLSGASLKVPALRERRSDIGVLVRNFLDEVGSDLKLTCSALKLLEAYDWPGNVRELRAEVSRWTVFCDGTVREEDLSLLHPDGSSEDDSVGDPVEAEHVEEAHGETYTLAEAVEHAEITALEYALHQFGGNLSQTARSLEIDRNTLKRKLKKYSLNGVF